MIEEVLEEQALVAEGTQLGTVFEDVLVDVAKNGSLNAAHPNGGKIPPGLKKKSYNGPHKNNTLLQLSIKSLEKMGWSLEEIKRGVDSDARKPDLKEKGIDGSPKTDVIIRDSDGNRWNISLKLSGDIQLGGAGVMTTIEILSKTLEEFSNGIEMIEEDLERKARQEIQGRLQIHLDRLTGLLNESAGKFFVHNNYVETLAKKLFKDGKYPDLDSARDYARDREQEFHNLELRDWEQWNKKIKSQVVQALSDFFLQNDEFLTYVVDEYLTGRRQFEGKEVAIANAYLSPKQWVTLQTIEDTKRLLTANNGAFKQAITSDARGRGRSDLAKEVSVKIEFKAKKYEKILKQLAAAAVTKSKCSAAPVPATMQEEVGECQMPETIARDLAEQATIKIDLNGQEPEHLEGT